MTYEFTEPLHNQFFTDPADESVLARVREIKVDLTWLSSLAPAFTNVASTIKDDASTPADCTLSFAFNTNCDLLMRTYQPTVTVPPVVKHKLTDYQVFSQDFTLSSMGSSTSVNMRSQTLTQVPSKLYFFARRSTDYSTAQHTDAYCAITSMTIRTDADQGGLSGASAHHLYDMSARNGNKQSWAEFRYRQGSVVSLNVAEDLGGYVPNVRSQFVIQPSVTLQNVQFETFRDSTAGQVGFLNIENTAASNYSSWTLYMVAIFDNEFSTDGVSASLQEGLNPVEAAAIRQMEPVAVTKKEHQGGSFFGSLAKFVMPVAREVLGNAIGNAISGSGVPSGSGIKVLN